METDRRWNKPQETLTSGHDVVAWRDWRAGGWRTELGRPGAPEIQLKNRGQVNRNSLESSPTKLALASEFSGHLLHLLAYTRTRTPR
jgi:hypothetical protein